MKTPEDFIKKIKNVKGEIQHLRGEILKEDLIKQFNGGLRKAWGLAKGNYVLVHIKKSASCGCRIIEAVNSFQEIVALLEKV